MKTAETGHSDTTATITALLFTGRADASFGMSNELQPLLGRSLLQRAVETLVRHGCRQIHVVLGDEPLPTRSLLDDGARWGCALTYHHSNGREPLGTLFRRLQAQPGQQYLLADAARMPADIDRLLQQTHPVIRAGTAYTAGAGSSEQWSGWGRFDGDWLLQHEAIADHQALDRCILADGSLHHQPAAVIWSVETPAQLLHTASGMLAAHMEACGQPVTTGRGCRIHPSARLSGPVHVGHGVRIGANSVIGPNVAIGDGALIEQDAVLENAVVQPETFVGTGLELRDAIAAGDLLANVRLNTLMAVQDPDLLSALPRARSATAPAWWEPITALALLGLLSPLRLVSGRRRGSRATPLVSVQHVRGRRHPLELPLQMADPKHVHHADGAPDLVRHFRECFYPGLRDVAARRLRLVGPTARSAEEIMQLPEPWRRIYREHRAGLLNEALTQEPADTLPDLQFACDSIACTQQGAFLSNLKLLRRYLGQVVRALPTGKRRSLRHNSDVSAPDTHRRTA
jgi:carbonic anhydrase/acetyltransferase-like protein (isoleucine patch superfamily)